jgi:hypothetical protein
MNKRELLHIILEEFPFVVVPDFPQRIITMEERKSIRADREKAIQYNATIREKHKEIRAKIESMTYEEVYALYMKKIEKDRKRRIKIKHTRTCLDILLSYCSKN